MTEKRKVSAAERRARQRKLRNRRIALILALVLVVVFASVAGTIAWLTDSTTPVTNTFTTAGIKIALTEEHGGPYQLIPSKSYTKDPVVKVIRTYTDDEGNTVQGTDVAVYLFVKFEAGNSGTYLDYTSSLTEANEWYELPVEGVDNVWYREVIAEESNPEWHLLENDTVTVRSNLEKAGSDGTLTMPSTNITMTYTAYAIQMEGFEDVMEAWAKLNPPTNP